MSQAIKTVGGMKKELANMQEQIKKAEDAQKKASQSLDKAKEKQEQIIKTVLKNSDAYQDAIKSIAEFKSRNEQITTSITKHEAEMASLQLAYKNSKTAYETAKNTLKELKSQYGANSAEVREQEIQVEALQTAYNTALNAYKQTKDAVSNLRAEYKSNTATIELQATAQEELKKQLLASNSAVRLIQRQIKGYEQKIDDAKKAVQEARSTIPSLTSEIKKNQKAFDDAKKTVKEWGKSLMSSVDGAIKRIGQVTVASASLAGGFAVKTGFETAFNLEAYRTQLETAVKDTEKASKLMKMAQDFSNASPFTSQETIQSTSTMEAYGVNSERWLKTVADMAGATNKEMEQATGALIDALTKQEFQGLEEFGISKEMVIDKANSMYGKNKIFKKSGELQKGKDAEMQKVIETLMQSKFDGGAEKLSKTVRGLWSTITGVTSDSLAKIFGMENGLIKSGSALDILKQKLEELANTLTKWQQDGTLDRIAEQFTVAMTQAINAVTNLFNFIKEHQKTIKIVVGMIALFYTFAKTIILFGNTLKALQVIYTITKQVSLFAKGLTILKNVVVAVKFAFLMIKASVLALTPTMLPVIAVIGVIAGIVYVLYKNFNLVSEAVKSVISWVKSCWDTFKSFFDAMPAWAKVLLLPVAPIFAIIDALELLSNAVGKAWKWVKGFFSDDEEKNITVNANESVEKDIKTSEEVLSNKTKASEKNISEKEYLQSLLNEAKATGKSPKEIFKEQIQKEKEVKTTQISKTLNTVKNTEKVIIKKEKPQINLTFNGDVYGLNDFKDKVKSIMDEVIEFDLQNAV